jgi:LuxR family maltose regulon positive regulatory protein
MEEAPANTGAALPADRADGGPVLVHTRVGPPPLHGHVIRRDRLLSRLDEASMAKLVLVACPAGYGKTTLLADWAASVRERHPVAWVSLDETDNDPVVLWAHLARALRVACPFLGKAVADEVAAQPWIVNRLLPRLVNALAEQRAVTLVIDDVHRLEPGVSREILGWLLDHQPETFQLVLSTRAEPRLPVARLRAQGQLLELRVNDLRFTHAEGMSLLNERDALGLATGDVLRLVERTEGWPAGLYLASLSLAATSDRHALVAKFGASNRHVVDFFVEEVMSSFGEELRDFMVRSSVLKTLSGPLCDAVLDRTGSQSTLAGLARTNLFLFPLDGDGTSYRYHNMFGQLLDVQLLNRGPDIARELHRRAMKWHRQHGAMHEAMAHALGAADVTAATEILAESWLSFFNAYKYSSVLAMLAEFPAGTVEGDPALSLIRAWALAFCGRHAEASRTLDAIAASFALDSGPVAGFSCLESGVRLLRAVFPNGDVGAQLENGRRVEELENPQSAWWPVGQYALGVASYLAGQFEEADTFFGRAQFSGLPSGQAVTVATAMAYRSLIGGELGNAAEQQRFAREADDFAVEHGLTNPLGAVHVAVGVAAAARGEYDSGIARLELGVEFVRTWGEPLVLAHALIRLAEVIREVGNQPQAVAILVEARAIVDSCRDPGALGDRLDRLGAGERDDSPVPMPGEPLTERERDVVRRLDSDQSQAQIAAALFVSFNTLHTHVRSAYRKLGASSRREAVARAKALGVIDER